MAERAVQTAKGILWKAKFDCQDPYLALLVYRNTPRDAVLGSPVQRLFSQRTKTTLPTSEGLLTPQIVEPVCVKARLQELKQQQKLHYDKGSVPLQPLKEGDVVRMKSVRGFDSQAIVRSPADQPRSYIVSRDGATYRRNRRDQLKVNEQPDFTTDKTPEVSTSQMTSSREKVTSSDSGVETQPSPSRTDVSTDPVQHSAVRRSGRTTRKPAYLQDYYAK